LYRRTFVAVTIVKASGRSEEFRIQKLVDSLVRSGASEDAAWEIARQVEKQITPSTKTKHIFRIARRLLRKYSRTSDMRYSIKKAIYLLGPSGYPFEKFFARIMKEQGYSVEVNPVLEGYCVTHEIDVLAGMDDRRYIIECKYHGNGGTPTDIKTALYVHSRFSDVKKAYDLNPDRKILIRQGWLVTNTRCTSEAIKYAECVGLRIVSWKYPEKESLERLIENKKLYPVTILSSVRKSYLDHLFANNIILAKDIADMDEQTFIVKSGLDAHSSKILKKEADELYFS
jgi:hypothetical protein